MINLNSDHSELLDVINEDDVIIESKSRDDIHHLGLLHREIHVWLFDKNNNIYFQKSGINKSNAGLFDASIGGHVDKGEEYVNAAVREIKEESGLSVSASDLILLTKFKNVSKNKKMSTINNFFRSIYIYKYPVSEEQIKEDRTENDGFKKFSLDFLSNMNKKNKAMFHKFVPTYELPLVLKYLTSQ